MVATRRLAELYPGYWWVHDTLGQPTGIVKVSRIGDPQTLAILDYHGAVTHLDHTPYQECRFSGPLEPPAGADAKGSAANPDRPLPGHKRSTSP